MKTRPIEHLDVLRALRRSPERLDVLEPALRSVLQAAHVDWVLALRRGHLFRAEDFRRVRAAAADLLQDVQDRP